MIVLSSAQVLSGQDYILYKYICTGDHLFGRAMLFCGLKICTGKTLVLPSIKHNRITLISRRFNIETVDQLHNSYIDPQYFYIVWIRNRNSKCKSSISSEVTLLFSIFVQKQA